MPNSEATNGSLQPVVADPYHAFSQVFDRIVSQEKYDKWERWIREVWEYHDFHPKSLVDIACGTGINAIRFSSPELQTYGVDRSDAMLAEARKKGSDVQFI